VGLELEVVYREHGARLWRAVLLATGSREVADDAVAVSLAQVPAGPAGGPPAAPPRRMGLAGRVPDRGR
jgi:hypothetical protein